MKDLKIIFYGTPDFAVGILETLVQNNKNIVAVVTAPDKPAGRGRKLQASAVKKFATQHSIKTLQPTNLKSDEFQAQLIDLQPDLQVVVAFRMLPEKVWKQAKYGTFNLHASLLPQYRGAAPINWAIINGETKTGVTTFFIDNKIDTGAIILQSEVNISPNDTAGSLHDKLMEEGAKLVLQTVLLIEQNAIETKIQTTSSDLKTAYKLHSDNTKINWNAPGNTIYNFVRGLSPYPLAWTYFSQNNEKVAVKIDEVCFAPEKHTNDIGSILVEKSDLKVAVLDGFIFIKSIKYPGKRKLDIASFLNGFKIEPKAQML